MEKANRAYIAAECRRRRGIGSVSDWLVGLGDVVLTDAWPPELSSKNVCESNL
jgi:hypothetical protein